MGERTNTKPTEDYVAGVEDIFEQIGKVGELCTDPRCPKYPAQHTHWVKNWEKDDLLTQGAKFDDGKTMLELLPPDALWAIGEVLTHGAHKYAPRNWEQGIEYGRVYGALLRHLFTWWRGEDNDPETGLPHLAHAGCCLLFLLSYELRGMKHFDDRWKPNGAEDHND